MRGQTARSTCGWRCLVLASGEGMQYNVENSAAPREHHLSPINELNHNYFEDVLFEKRVWTASANISNYAMVFTAPWLGHHDKLGRRSFRHLLVTLSESEIIPKYLIFWNRAVRICVEGSRYLPILNQIEKAGVRILVSAHALEVFKMKAKLRVGRLANNFDFLEAINKVQKVVSF